MTQYSSREPFERGEWWGYPDGWVVEEMPQHNPTNPILTEFRFIEAEGIWDGLARWITAGAWADMINEDPSMSNPFDWGRLAGTLTPEQIDHARTVLTRLANLKEES